MRHLAFLALLALGSKAVSASTATPFHLRFASPLQSLTIVDKEVRDSLKTTRERFLPKFRAGLEAEVQTRRKLARKRAVLDDAISSGSDWVERAWDLKKKLISTEDATVEEAHDNAVASIEAMEETTTSTSRSGNRFQFVGVVNKDGEKAVTWYARKKPSKAKWSVRLVHVNRDAIIQDLFQSGKVDVFGKYKNSGVLDEETKTPIIKADYELRERSWKNLWNFSPKHFFTDPSGMYWRERRLRPGLYTDGTTVYESSYRYSDGRNGMHAISDFEQFLNSKSIQQAQKDRILKRLKEDAPDIVVEV